MSGNIGDADLHRLPAADPQGRLLNRHTPPSTTRAGSWVPKGGRRARGDLVQRFSRPSTREVSRHVGLPHPGVDLAFSVSVEGPDSGTSQRRRGRDTGRQGWRVTFIIRCGARFIGGALAAWSVRRVARLTLACFLTLGMGSRSLSSKHRCPSRPGSLADRA